MRAEGWSRLTERRFSLRGVLPPWRCWRAAHEIDRCQEGIEHAGILALLRDRAQALVQRERILMEQIKRLLDADQPQTLGE